MVMRRFRHRLCINLRESWLDGLAALFHHAVKCSDGRAQLDHFHHDAHDAATQQPPKERSSPAPPQFSL
jgi:hypothetical protein